MKAEYFKTAEDVIFFSPITRFWSKIFGKDKYVLKCKDCNKIPTEIVSGYCWSCLPKTK